MNDQEKVLQQKYMELQLLDQQIRQVQQQHSLIQQQIEELLKLDVDLEEFSKVKENSKAFFPLAQGVFAQGTIENTKELLINVGADISVKKTIPEAKILVREQVTELQNALKDIDEGIGYADTKAQELQEEIMALDSKLNKGHKCDENCDHEHQ